MIFAAFTLICLLTGTTNASSPLPVFIVPNRTGPTGPWQAPCHISTSPKDTVICDTRQVAFDFLQPYSWSVDEEPCPSRGAQYELNVLQCCPVVGHVKKTYWAVRNSSDPFAGFNLGIPVVKMNSLHTGCRPNCYQCDIRGGLGLGVPACSASCGKLDYYPAKVLGAAKGSFYVGSFSGIGSYLGLIPFTGSFPNYTTPVRVHDGTWNTYCTSLLIQGSSPGGSVNKQLNFKAGRIVLNPSSLFSIFPRHVSQAIADSVATALGRRKLKAACIEGIHAFELPPASEVGGAYVLRLQFNGPQFSIFGLNSGDIARFGTLIVTQGAKSYLGIGWIEAACEDEWILGGGTGLVQFFFDTDECKFGFLYGS